MGSYGEAAHSMRRCAIPSRVMLLGSHGNAPERWWSATASSYHIVCSSVAGLLRSTLAAYSKLAGDLCASVGLWCEEKSHTMSEVLLLLFLDIEQAHVNGDESPVFGCFLDNTKYCDFSRMNSRGVSFNVLVGHPGARSDATAVCWTHACSRD